MKKILGIFRGFPGLGRVVAGVSLMETLHKKFGCAIKFISYLQGKKYLQTRGFNDLPNATTYDYSSIGLLPTNKMGVYIHNTVKNFLPDLIILDGEPLILHSLKISYPNLPVAILLNPSDVDNPKNDKEAMDFFNALYSSADLAIVHGLRKVTNIYNYRNFISVGTILRQEIFNIKPTLGKEIFCILGGGTVNSEDNFKNSTLNIAELCIKAAPFILDYRVHIVSSCQEIFNELNKNPLPRNVILPENIIDAQDYYSKAGLVIARAGRNTLSELVYLGIPAIAFVSNSSYRAAEQTQNLKSLNAKNILAAPANIELDKFVSLCRKILNSPVQQNKFQCGNEVALEKIFELLTK